MNDIPPADQLLPRGGSFACSNAVSNLRRDQSPSLRITWFDVACDSVVYEGQPLDGLQMPPGLVMQEKQGSTALLYPDGGFIVLRGVVPKLWAAGAAQQIHGTAGNDGLMGTVADEVFALGGGSDQVAPAAGDDHILYTSGSMTILNSPPNLGEDRLDLRRYNANDLALRKDGSDLNITTPNGVIVLKGQFDPDGNIENILLTEDTILTSADMRVLAGL